MTRADLRESLLIVVMSAVGISLLAVDGAIELGVAGAIPYVLVVSLAVFSRWVSLVWLAALGCSGLTVLGLYSSPPGGEMWKVLANRGLSLCAIWLVASLCYGFKRTRNQLQEQQQISRSILDSSLDPVVVIDHEGIVLDWTPQAEVLFGWSREDASGREVAELIIPERYQAAHREGLRHFMQTGRGRVLNRRLELTARRRNGEEFPVELTVTALRLARGYHFSAFLRDITERKQRETHSQEALRASEDKLIRAVTEAPFPAMIHAEDGEVVMINRAWTELSGYKHGDIPTIFDWTERAYGTRKTQVQEMIAQLHSSASRGVGQGDSKEYTRTQEGEFNITTRDGAQRTWDFSSTSLGPLPDGRQVVLSMATDVTERRQVEERVRQTAWELAAANADLQQIHHALSDLAAHLAMPPREIHPVETTFRPSDFSLTDMMLCGAAIRALRRTCGDKGLFAEALVRFLYERFVDEQGNPAFALVRFFETQTLAELHEQLQTVVHQFQQGGEEKVADKALHNPETPCLILLASAGQQEAWNDPRQSVGHRVIPLPSPEAVERLPMIAQLIRQLGFEVGGVLHANQGGFPHARSILVERSETGVFHVADAQGSPHIPAQETFVVPFGIRSVVGYGDVTPDGRFFAVILFARVPIPDDVAQLFGYLSLSTRLALLSYLEITGRTEAQIISLDRLLRTYEEIVRTQERKLRASLHDLDTLNRSLQRSNLELEQFASIASHDLQEPLRKVLTFSDMLLAEYHEVLDKEGRDYLSRMSNACERMKMLINDLLAFSRVTTKGKPFQPVDLNEVTRQVLVDLEIRLQDTQGQVEAEELPTIEADPTQMQQLLQNLISNALKYHRKDEPPRVKVRGQILARETDHSRVSWCEITVADNGIGFEEKFSERIFAPFQRLHGRKEYEGTGMGLAICRKIVDRHGGTIVARSTQGQGSTFVVTLPVQAQAPRVSPEDQQPSGQSE